MEKVLLLLHPGFEEIEAVTPADLLRRAGLEVRLASVTGELLVVGGRGIAVRADALLRDCAAEDYALLVLPGGPGVDALRKSPEVRELARRFAASDRLLAAICAAPLVLLDAGLLEGRTVTSFPGVAAELRERVGSYSEERVARDGRLITSRGAGTAEEFALALIAVLRGDTEAEKIQRQVVAR